MLIWVLLLALLIESDVVIPENILSYNILPGITIPCLMVILIGDIVGCVVSPDSWSAAVTATTSVGMADS